MTVALANALRKGWFAFTNAEKGNNYTRADRLERKVTSYCQDISTADETIKVVKETTKGSKCVDALARTLNSSKKTSKLLDWSCKGAEFASKAVNPLLCVAAGARVLNAEDKKSSFIQEGLAMGAMFGVEGIIKSNLGLAGKSAKYVNNKFLLNLATKTKTFLATTKFLNKIPTNRLTGIIKAAIFVIGSCTAFAAGQKLGKVITKNTTEKDFQEKKLLKEQMQLAKLMEGQKTSTTNFVG